MTDHTKLPSLGKMPVIESDAGAAWRAVASTTTAAAVLKNVMFSRLLEGNYSQFLVPMALFGDMDSTLILCTMHYSCFDADSYLGAIT